MPGRTAGAGAASRLSDTGSSRGNRHRRRPAHSTGANANATASAHARGVSGSASGRDDVAASGAHTVVPSRAEAPSHTTWSDLPDARDPQEVERINQRIQAIAGHPVFTGRDPVTGRRRRGGAAWHEAAQRAALPLSHTRGFHTGNSGDDYADGDALDDAQADADYNAALDAFYEHRYAQSRGDHARNSATTRRFDFDEPEWPDESDQENESDNTLAMNVEELRQRRARMFRAVREASGEGECGEVPLETAHNGNLRFHLVSCDGGDYGMVGVCYFRPSVSPDSLTPAINRAQVPSNECTAERPFGLLLANQSQRQPSLSTRHRR